MYECQTTVNRNAIFQNENLLNERVDAINNLSNDVIQVNEIFTDLAILVHEQGTHIDNIETNINRAHINIERGTNQVEKINKRSKKNCRCLYNTLYICCFIDSCLILVLIIKIIKKN